MTIVNQKKSWMRVVEHAPKVIGHMELCRAQFTILSMVDNTYSITLRKLQHPAHTVRTTRTSLVRRCLQTELIRVKLRDLCNRRRRGRSRGGGDLSLRRLLRVQRAYRYTHIHHTQSATNAHKSQERTYQRPPLAAAKLPVAPRSKLHTNNQQLSAW